MSASWFRKALRRRYFQSRGRASRRQGGTASSANEHGIFHFDGIAAWKKADIEAAQAYLAFDGRIAREDWIGRAKRLAEEVAAKPEKCGGRK